MMQQLIERWRERVGARLVLAEAIVYLLAVRCALRVFSFQQLVRFFERSPRRPELTGDARIRARKEVRSAILKLFRYYPRATTCFHRSIAAQAMLRRRGIGATLYYGAATLPERGLTTHAWVLDDDEGVVGHVTAKRGHYHVLARYPELRP